MDEPAPPRPLRKGAFLDVDGDYDAFELPVSTYGPDHHRISWEDIQNAGNPEWRKANGLDPLAPLPPLLYSD